MAKLLRFFPNTDLRCAHEGLAELAKRNKVNVTKLEPGEYVIFTNAARDRIKLFAANNVLAYLKILHGKIDMRTISLIPQAFEASGKIDYDDALKEVLMKQLPLLRSPD